MNLRVEQQCHGYKNGHQMLSASVRLSRGDQDLVDRISDISGPLRPAETFAPYVSAYPLPSGQHYVIAKTWQDLVAPRAGCVLTRSLLIDMSSWKALDYPASLMSLFHPVDKSASSAPSIDFETKSICMAPVKTLRVVSLVEALFLEDRNPIVMFEEPESDLICLRLLSALWPAFRQSFSLCTLALSPRTIGGKSFDLMFAPREAKSRFSQWQGRVFDSPSSFTRPDSPRHRWSLTTTEHIFIDDPPSLVSLDALGVLGASDAADEASLRLALLWNELLEKAETSPTAILGLLDILRSRGKVSSEEVTPFLPVLLHGIELAKVSLGGSEALHFVLTLVGKFPSKRPPIEVLNKIREVLSFSASQQPQAVLDLYRDKSLGKELRTPLVTAGLGDGLANSLNGPALLALASQFAPEDQLRLIAYSKEWTQSIFEAADTDFSDWSSWLTRALQYRDDDLSARARSSVLPYLCRPIQAPLLVALLDDVDSSIVLSIADQIRLNVDFQVAAFDQPLSNAAKRTGSIRELREVILKTKNEEWADRFLLATMTLNWKDVEWIFEQELFNHRRLANLCLALFRSASDDSVKKFTENENLSSRLERMFVEELPSASVDLARLLLFGNFPVSRLLSAGKRILNNLDATTRNSLSRLMLERGLSSGSDADNAILAFLLSQSAAFSDARTIVFAALSDTVSKNRVMKNLVLIDQVHSSLRHGILNEIEVITDHLTRRYSLDFTTEAVHSWGALLRDAGSVNPYGQGRAAAKVLSFALEHRSNPYSELVVASFPFVYEQLRSGQDSPGLLSFFFNDWDRCKTARKDITRAFLHSEWPALDLLRAVAPTGDLEKVFRTLSREKEGGIFLSKLEAGLSALSKSDQRGLKDLLGNVFEQLEADASLDSD